MPERACGMRRGAVLMLALGVALASMSPESSSDGEVPPEERLEAELRAEIEAEQMQIEQEQLADTPSPKVDAAEWKRWVTTWLPMLEQCVDDAAATVAKHEDGELPAGAKRKMGSCAGRMAGPYEWATDGLVSTGIEAKDHAFVKVASSADDIFMDFRGNEASGRFTNSVGVKLAIKRFRRDLAELKKTVK